MTQSETDNRFEPRWPVALAVLTVGVLLALLPQRIQIFPAWIAYALSAALIMSVSSVALSRGKNRWSRRDRLTTLVVAIIAALGNVVNLIQLIRATVHPTADTSGLQLLSSSIALWTTNVLVFSLLYWALDRGGPEPRARNAGIRPDWRFPQDDGGDDVAPEWRPVYADYLFLSFSSATAFSATDVAPLTLRAKMLMMVQSALSLTTLAVVAARAINILGG